VLRSRCNAAILTGYDPQFTLLLIVACRSLNYCHCLSIHARCTSYSNPNASAHLTRPLCLSDPLATVIASDCTTAYCGLRSTHVLFFIHVVHLSAQTLASVTAPLLTVDRCGRVTASLAAFHTAHGCPSHHPRTPYPESGCARHLPISGLPDACSIRILAFHNKKRFRD
jgi:hypothetical protein